MTMPKSIENVGVRTVVAGVNCVCATLFLVAIFDVCLLFPQVMK